MSNATHTPGPWRQVTALSSDWNNIRYIEANDTCAKVATIHHYPGMEQSEALANARLTIAAPDLLAALEWLRDEYCEGGALDGTEAERRILVAIAKAKGTAA